MVRGNANCSHKEEAIFSFLHYLELIKSRAKGFMYKVASNESGKKKKFMGVLWLTVTMCCNFELFCAYLCFDI